MKRFEGVRDPVLLALVAIAAVLLLSNLHSGYLWQDEAETALLARNTLRFGYPKAFDGRNTIEEPLHGYGPGDAWIYSPWLPFYLLAAVFSLVGESTWSARLPFAILGLFSVYLTWRVVRRLIDDRDIQRLSVALLVCSVPFLLHMRQCRYYAMTVVLFLAMCLAYLQFHERPSFRHTILLSLTCILLFHTNFGTFLPAFAVILMHQFRWRRQEEWTSSLTMLSLVLLFTVPWAFFFYRSAFIGTISFGRIWHHLEYYVRILNKYFLPIGAMAVSTGLCWARARKPFGWQLWNRLKPSVRQFFLLMIAAQLVFLVVPDQRHMRYLLPILPLLAIVEAAWLIECQARYRIIGGFLITLALLTNALQSIPPRIPLADMVYELTHRYQGPLEGIIAYLRQHAHPHDIVKIPYDDRTIMFYTQLTVERPSQFLRETDPDWVILRRSWVPASFLQSDYFRRIQATYERIELDAPDTYWQNREDPGSHHFRTVRDAPRVVLYRKRESPHG